MKRIAATILALAQAVAGEAGTAEERPAIDPRSAADVGDAVEIFTRELGRLEADPAARERTAATAATFFAEVERQRAERAGEHERLRHALGAQVARGASTSDGIRDQLLEVLVESAQLDRAERVLSERITPQTVGLDEANRDVTSTGPDGTVWVFWAIDAPGSDRLAGMLNRLRAARPGLRIADVHMVPLRRWHALIAAAAKQRDQLLLDVPGETREQGVERRKRILAEVLTVWQGFTDMASYYREGGYRLVEDMTAARLYEVRSLPSFRFVSRRGVVHRLDGINSQVELTTWIARCEQWEATELEGVLRRAQGK